MSSVLAFMENNGSDHKKRKLLDIIKEDDHFWEREHDFIQWLFPLDEKSMAVPKSPVLRAPEIQDIKDSQIAQEALQKATKRFKQFLHNSFDWRYYNDHNHLRITRVIKSLRLTVSDASATNFKRWIYDELDEDLERISHKTRSFWQDA